MESASERAIRERKKRDVESDKRAIRAWFATGLNVLPSSFEIFNFIRYVRPKPYSLQNHVLKFFFILP